MKDEINHPNHYTAGTPEVIDIIDAWGLAADYYAGNVLKYFLRAPYKGTEEKDYRKAMWYLQKIYERDIGMHCDLLYHNRITCSPMRLRAFKLNLNWFRPLSYHQEVTLLDVIKGWNLEDDRFEFIKNFYYQTFNCERCIRILDKIIEDVSDYENEDDLL